MSSEPDPKAVETTEAGFLANLEDWNEQVAEFLAGREGIALTERHWDVVNFLRDQYFNNHENLPNTRAMLKALAKIWGRKVDSKDLFELFPGNPSKQAGLIAGLPESRRKGGY